MSLVIPLEQPLGGSCHYLFKHFVPSLGCKSLEERSWVSRSPAQCLAPHRSSYSIFRMFLKLLSFRSHSTLNNNNVNTPLQNIIHFCKMLLLKYLETVSRISYLFRSSQLACLSFPREHPLNTGRQLKLKLLHGAWPPIMDFPELQSCFRSETQNFPKLVTTEDGPTQSPFSDTAKSCHVTACHLSM